MSRTAVTTLDDVGQALVQAAGEAKAFGLRTLDDLADRLRRAMDAGLLRPIDADHAAAIVWATCHGVMSLELAHPEGTPVDWERVFADATASVIKGLAA